MLDYRHLAEVECAGKTNEEIRAELFRRTERLNRLEFEKLRGYLYTFATGVLAGVALMLAFTNGWIDQIKEASR